VQGGRGDTGVTHRLRSSDEPPRPLAGFARTLVVLLSIIGALYAIEFLVELGYIGVLQDYLSGDASVQDVEDIRAASAGVQVLSGALSLVAAGFFIAWTYRAYENLERTSVAGLRYDAKWAIAAWFIPVAWWIRPKQMLNDVWRAGEPGVEVRDTSWHARPVSPLVHWWWALWVVAALIGIAAGIVGFDSDGVLSGRAEYEREQEAATVAAPGILCTACAAILACLVVRRITDREERVRAAVLAEVPEATPVAPAGEASAPAREGIAEGSRLRCPICGWVFREPQDLSDHLARHHPEHAEGGGS
jgi:Domain of unknown function (DUF4328)